MLRKSLYAGLAALLLGVAACQSGPAEQTGPASQTAAPAAAADSAATPAVATAAYICPMGCEGSASNKPGKCPVCEMDLEPNPAATTAAPAAGL
ncbi:heavy metal-binding domain-containing protein [Hymenobacter weizhouensis]|uniref:heavy metal-binding domain-containing protein n=1 Tax=Hymenobacter sp. YIM 151500-1 TaxID=2987689 RepID=UPI0022265484|nr:heavy metal-binding domain-containing protein [Hymenobacter sp. YIM 151500-1]UYZ62414.1 hypothetical protein OIS53_15610 [Hymenobacter sp. YIM 151500-1]